MISFSLPGLLKPLSYPAFQLPHSYVNVKFKSILSLFLCIFFHYRGCKCTLLHPLPAPMVEAYISILHSILNTNFPHLVLCLLSIQIGKNFNLNQSVKMKNCINSQQNYLENLANFIPCPEPPWTLTRHLLIWDMLNHKQNRNKYIQKSLFK